MARVVSVCVGMGMDVQVLEIGGVVEREIMEQLRL